MNNYYIKLAILYKKFKKNSKKMLKNIKTCVIMNSTQAKERNAVESRPCSFRVVASIKVRFWCALALIVIFNYFGGIKMNNNNLVRFLLTFFLGFLGSFIINHTSLKPEGYTSRTLAYFLLSYLTCGIYPLVASICNLTFDPAKPSNIGYIKGY